MKAINKALKKQETIILEGMENFVKVGLAWKKIRDDKLYRADGFAKFDDYCAKKWKTDRSYVNRTIRASQTRLALPDPKANGAHWAPEVSQNWTERNVRPLTLLPAARAKAVGKKALALATKTGKPLTAALVTKLVKEETGEKPKPKPKKSWKPDPVKRMVEPQFVDVINEMIDDIRNIEATLQSVPEGALELFSEEHPSRAKTLVKAIESLEKSLQRAWTRL